MAKSDWLSIDEIARLWGEETGLDAAAFQKDLEAWFAKFVKQPPAAGSRPLLSAAGDANTNRLMGMLGARYLERTTFEAFCRERGHAKPRFWFGDRHDESQGKESGGDESRGDRPHPADSESPSPEAMRAPSGRERSRGSADDQSELAAFQSQIANLRDRLETPKIDFPSFSKRTTAGRRSQDAEPERTEPSAAAIEQELIERAAAASAEADDLKAQLAAAERRIADLSAKPASAASPSDSNLPPWDDATSRFESDRPSPDRPSPGSYRDPNATRQLLKATSTRRRKRRRAVVMAGLGVAFVALSLWGADTVLELASEQQRPISSETAGSTSGPSPADAWPPPVEPAERTAAGPVQPGTAATAGPPSGATEAAAVATDLAAAQQQITRLGQAVEASDKMVARLQDELAIARQAVDTARRIEPDETAGWTRDQQLAFRALSTEVAMARRELEEARLKATANADAELQRQEAAGSAAGSSDELAALKSGLEVNRQQTAELTSALERANEEADSLRAALKRAEEQAAQAESVRRAAEAASTEARAALANAEQGNTSISEKLVAASASVADANKSAASARAEAIRLNEDNAGLTEQVAKLNAETSRLRAALQRGNGQAGTGPQDPTLAATAASARLAALQRELETAYRKIDTLNKIVTPSEEAEGLPEGLAAQAQGAASLPGATPQSAAPTTPTPLAAREARPEPQQDPGSETAASPGGSVPAASTQGSHSDPPDADETQSAGVGSAEPEIEELLTAAESSPDPVAIPAVETASDAGSQTPGNDPATSETQGVDTSDRVTSTVPPPPAPIPGPDTDPTVEPAAEPTADPTAEGLAQVAELESTAAVQTDAVDDSVAPDDLLFDPGKHVGREVVVTGSVVWLLWRYRLQSGSGPGSIIIDVEGLEPTERNRLREAVNQVGFLGEVRVRIRGRFERDEESSYHLAASELAVIE